MSAALERAQAAMELRRWDEALRQATAAVADEPESVEAHGVRANCLLGMGRPLEALAQSETGLKLDPDNEWLHRVRSAALLAAGRPGDALAAADESVRVAPQTADTHATRAEALVKLRRLREAAEGFRRALELSPGSATCHRQLADVLLDVKDYSPAEEHYRTSLSLNPNSSVTLNNYGVTLEAQGRAEEARLAFKAAILVNPADKTAKRNVKSSVDRYLSGTATSVAAGGVGLGVLLRAALVGGRTAVNVYSTMLLVLVLVALVILSFVWLAERRAEADRRRTALAALDPQVRRVYEQVEKDHRAGRL